MGFHLSKSGLLKVVRLTLLTAKAHKESWRLGNPTGESSAVLGDKINKTMERCEKPLRVIPLSAR